MAECLLLKSGGAYGSDDCTAAKSQVLSGYTAITSDSDEEPASGTMPDNTGIATNGSVPGYSSDYPNVPTREAVGQLARYHESTDGVKRVSMCPPAGYYQGGHLSYVNCPAQVFGDATTGQVLSGKKFTSANGVNISGTISSKAAATYYATTSDQTISSGQYLSGAQTIKGLTQTNLSGANIKPGVTIQINNGNANVWSVASTMANKTAQTYYATTANQTIAANQYLSGAQTINKLTQTNLAAGNIKAGTTVKINNGNADVWSVTGTCKIFAANRYASAIKGYGASTNTLTDEDSYTMPRAGTVYYGMGVVGAGGQVAGKAELIVNNVVKDSVQIGGSGYTYSHQWAIGQSLNVSANDVVKVKCTITNGTHVFCIIGAHFQC